MSAASAVCDLPGEPAGPAARAVLPAIVFTLVLSILPVGLMLFYSFMKAAPYGGVEPVFSFDAYRSLLFRRDLFSGDLAFSADHLVIFGRTVFFAALTTLLCFVLGFPTAWFMAMQPPARRKWWVLAITIPFWTSLLVRTLALMIIISDGGVINGMLLGAGLVLRQPVVMLYTDFAVGLGLVYSFLPFMILPLYSSLSKLDMRLLEAGADLYAGRWRILSRIVLPAIRPGIASGVLLVFLPALGAYVVPLILGGGASMMIGDLIALQFGSARNWPLGAAQSTVMTLAVVAALIVFRKLEGKRA